MADRIPPIDPGEILREEFKKALGSPWFAVAPKAR